MLKIQRSAMPLTRPIIIALTMMYLALCLAYNIALPLFEAPDEGAHYQYVDYIARNRALPSMDNMPSHEVSQPPLYYVLAAPLIAWIDRNDFGAVYLPNPGLDNGIVYDHSPIEREFPPRGVVLAMRILRLYSTAFGALTILLVYATAHALLQRQDIALVAMAVTAFNPKFLHMSSQFNNDIAVACAAALTLWLVTRMIRQPSRPSIPQFIAAGAAAGLALAFKYSGIVLVAPVALSVTWLTFKCYRQSSLLLPAQRIRGTIGYFMRGGIASVIGFLITSGWLLLYNTLRYGDPLAVVQVQRAHALGVRPVPLSIVEIIGRLPKVLTSYWGEFGHGVQFPASIDHVMLILAAVICVGLAVAALRRQVPAGMSLLVVTALIAFTLFIAWMRTQTGTENSRLLSTAISSVSILAAIGLMTWVPHAWKTIGALAIAVVSVGGGVGGLFLSLIPGYATPNYLTATQVAALPAQGRVTFDNGIELVSAVSAPDRITPGNEMEVGVYWRATQPITDVWRVVIELRDEHDQSLGRISTLPLGGRFATTQMEVGRIFHDVYRVPVTATQRSVARVLVGWYQQRLPHNVSLVRGSGAASAQIGLVKVRGAQPAEQLLSVSFQSRFGDVISLEGYRINTGELTLYWRCLTAPVKDYKVFVHALDDGGKIIGQVDGFVSYSTIFWESGEQIIDVRPLAQLRNAAAVRIGLYDAITEERLPAQRADGTTWQDNAVIVTIQTTP